MFTLFFFISVDFSDDDNLRIVRRELHRLVGELRGEVGKIAFGLQPRSVRRRHLLLFQLKKSTQKRHKNDEDKTFDAKTRSL